MALRIPKAQGEIVRNKLASAGILNRELKIILEDEFLFIPVKEPPQDATFKPYEILEREFSAKIPKIKTYRDIIELPDNLRDDLPTSFDIIGQIALLKLNDEIISYKDQIAEAMLQAHKHLKTVALDRGVKGEYRIRDIEILAGSSNTETIHKEYGVRLAVDLADVYFSPRLSQERYRVAQAVQDGERVIDMFAGVGPFSIMIARYSNPSIIYSIDKNPKAIEYLKKNIELNSVNNIEPICSDASSALVKLVNDKLPEKADRIIMNLPHAAKEFLLDALGAIKIGGTIHYHEILDNRQFETRVDEVLKEILKFGFESEVTTKLIIGTYSPSEIHICLDLKILSESHRNQK